MLGRFPKLRDLTLFLRSMDDRWPEATDMPVTLPALRNFGFICNIVKGDLPRCGRSLVALAEAAPGVTGLALRFGGNTAAMVIAMEEDVCDVLECLPRLTSVSFSHGGRRVLPRYVRLLLNNGPLRMPRKCFHVAWKFGKILFPVEHHG